MFCKMCKICLHTYECDCVEYAVKTSTCKHVQAVAMYKQEISKYVSAEFFENLQIVERSTSKQQRTEEIIILLK